MSSRCALRVCREKSKNLSGKASKCHMFPKDETMRSEWESWVKEQNHVLRFKAARTAALCRSHFNQENSYHNGKLKEDAVPTIPPECDVSLKFKFGWIPQDPAMICDKSPSLPPLVSEEAPMEVIQSDPPDHLESNSKESTPASIPNIPPSYTCKHCGNECSDVMFLTILENGGLSLVPVVKVVEHQAASTSTSQRNESNENVIKSSQQPCVTTLEITTASTSKIAGNVSEQVSILPPTISSALDEFSAGVTTDSAALKTVRKAYLGDLSPEDFSTPQKTQKNLELVKSSMSNMRGRLRATQMRLNRALRQVADLKSLLFS